jgi:hypothetical protein
VVRVLKKKHRNGKNVARPVSRKRIKKQKRGAIVYGVRLRETVREADQLARRMFAVVTVVIAVIPIAVAVPTVFIFIPPAVIAGVAALASFVQFMTRVLCLFTVPAMVFDGFVKPVIGPGNAALAIVVSA